MTTFFLKTVTVFVILNLLIVNKTQAQWEKLNTLNTGAYGVAADSGLIVAYKPYQYAYISSDTGKNWRNFTINTFNEIYLKGKKIFSKGYNNVLISKNKGITWVEIEKPFQGYRPISLIVIEQNVYLSTRDSALTGDKFFIYKYNENANKWDIQSYFPANTITFNVTANKIFAITPDSFFVSNRNTISWVAKSKSPYFNLSRDRGIARITASDAAVILNTEGSFYTSQNEGATWTQPYGFISGEKASCIFKNGKFYFVYGKVRVSNDNGLTWRVLENGWTDQSNASNTDNLTITGAIDGNTIYATTESLGIMSMNINNEQWQYLPTTPIKSNITKIIPLADGSFLAADGNYGFHKSVDKGKTWQPLPNPPDAYHFNDARAMYDIATKNNYVFMHANMAPYGSYYIGARSEDYGKTWRKDDSLPLFSNHLFRGDTLYVIGQSGRFTKGIRYSLPPYTSWRLVSDEQLQNSFIIKDDIIVAEAFAPWTIARMTKNGTPLPPPNRSIPVPRNDMIVKDNKIFLAAYDSLYISADNGLNWTVKSFNRPTFSSSGSYVYLTVINNLLVAITENEGIYVSKDEGTTWVMFREGLKPLEVNGFGGYRGSFFTEGNYFYATFSSGFYRRSISDFSIKTISGKVFKDNNNNGRQDNGELPLSNVIVSTKASNAHALTDATGFYTIQVEPIANDTLKISPPSPYTTVKPAFYVALNTDSTYNFGVYTLPNVKDLAITATSIQPARPGFNNKIMITVENRGTTSISTKVSMKYDLRVQFIDTDTRPVVDTPQYFLNWNLGFLEANQIKNIVIEFKTPVSVSLNSVLMHSFKVEPITSDTFPKDNVDTLRLTVVGSYDPNDKQVNRTKEIDIKQFNANNEWQYTIRFQNTGNYPTSFIRIVDTLSQNLDISTLQILSSSHPMTYTVGNKNVLIFYFDDVVLPDSTSNEAASHGFVKYAIKPLKSLTIGSAVNNTAYIYFDYNLPIVTNTTQNKIVQMAIVEDTNSREFLLIAPNPTTGITQFSLPLSFSQLLGASLHLEVFDISGRLVYNKEFVNQKINSVNLDNLDNGLYFMIVRQNNQLIVGKILLNK